MRLADFVPTRALLCHRSRRVVAALLAAVSIQADGQATAVPLPDSTLGRLLAPAVFDSLRGGGYRLGMQWIAGDPLTHAALATAATERGLVLRPPQGARPQCPASGGAADGFGYQVYVRVVVDRAGQLFAQASVGCRMGDRTPGGFAEGMTWEATKTPTGWRLGRRRDHYIT